MNFTKKYSPINEMFGSAQRTGCRKLLCQIFFQSFDFWLFLNFLKNYAAKPVFFCFNWNINVSKNILHRKPLINSYTKSYRPGNFFCFQKLFFQVFWFLSKNHPYLRWWVEIKKPVMGRFFACATTLIF